MLGQIISHVWDRMKIFSHLQGFKKTHTSHTSFLGQLLEDVFQQNEKEN